LISIHPRIIPPCCIVMNEDAVIAKVCVARVIGIKIPDCHVGIAGSISDESCNKDRAGYNGISCIFFNDTATTEIYTLSLHDALPI